MKNNLLEPILNELDFGVSYTKDQIWNICKDLPSDNEWIDIADGDLYKDIDSRRLVAKFSNGECKMYNDNWPMEFVTHVLILPE